MRRERSSQFRTSVGVPVSCEIKVGQDDIGNPVILTSVEVEGSSGNLILSQSPVDEVEVLTKYGRWRQAPENRNRIHRVGVGDIREQYIRDKMTTFGNKITDRQRLLRMVQGEVIDDSVRYEIEYSVDIRGNLTIWGGIGFHSDMDNLVFEKSNQRVKRKLRPLYEYERLSPYTARIYQMEQDIDRTISDDKLIEAYQKFREIHKTDGFGFRLLLLNIQEKMTDENGVELRCERDDRQEVLDRLLRQERQDILNLWGVDCPPDINSSDKYGDRLNEGRGQVSEWYRQEFKRIGGDYDRLWIQVI